MVHPSNEDWARPITVNPGNLTTPTRPTTLAPLTQSTTPKKMPGPQQYWGNAFSMGLSQQSYTTCAPAVPYGLQSSTIVPFGMANSAFTTVPQQKREDSPSPFAFNVPHGTPAQQHQSWPWVPSNTAHSSFTQPTTAYPPAYANPEMCVYPQYGNPHKVVPMSYRQHLQLVPPAIRSNTATTMGSRSSSEVVSACQGTPSYVVYTIPNHVGQASVPSSLAYASSASSNDTHTHFDTPQSLTQSVTSPESASVTSGDDSFREDVEMSSNGGSRRPPMTAVGSPTVLETTPRKKKRADPRTGPNFLTKLFE